MDHQHSVDYQNLKLKALQKTQSIEKGTYEIPSMDTAFRSDDSPKFFGNTKVVKSNDDFDTEVKDVAQAENQIVLNG
jgi:hypothetical protein